MSEAALSAVVLVLTLALFVSERIRHDLVGLLALLACVALGLVTPREALAGFGDEAVVAVAAVLVMGRALELSGLPAAVARRVIPAGAHFSLQLGLLMAMAALLSAFMNNIAALVIAMPLATEVARRAGLPAGAALMPLAFATILGGMTTLIGTPANLILSSVREDYFGEPLEFFAMTPVGGAVTGIGLAYLSVIGWRLIPLRRTEQRSARPWRVFELIWPSRRDSLPIRPALRKAGARLLGAFRDGARLEDGAPLRPGDRLLIISRSDQSEVAQRAGLDPTSNMRSGATHVTSQMVVAHGSPLIGQGYAAVRTLAGGDVSVIAGGPRPARLRQPLETILIEAGDQLFLRGPAEGIARLIGRARLLEVDRFDPAPLDARRALATGVVFVLAVAAAVTRTVPPAIAFLAAAAAVAALNLIRGDEAYRSIDWPIILLLATMIPVGRAFESSGAAAMTAEWFGSVLAGAPVVAVLAAICAGTLLLSIFLNNVATAVIMGPVAIQLSDVVGVEPDQAILAVLVGASSDFLTPIGHQNNLLVMGPGGYRFTDYARTGAPLACLTVITAAIVLGS